MNRCPHTIHSDYVQDHQCKRVEGHDGECLFGGDAPVQPEPCRTVTVIYPTEHRWGWDEAKGDLTCGDCGARAVIA